MKKTILHTFLAFFLLSGQLFAQQVKISGTVTDAANGSALAGATVRVKGKPGGATTDGTGRYSLDADAKDALEFSYTGYEPLSESVNGRSEINAMLRESATSLAQVVVVGSRRANRVQTETPVPVDVINVGAASVTSARTDVTSILNQSAPSFNFTKQNGSDGADHIDLATLRGLGPDQTLVLVNGKRRHQTAFVSVFGTRGRGNSGTDLGAIPALAIDRVEILRDGASAQYGSDAIAGVINIILKKNLNKFSADLGFSGYYDSKHNPAFIQDSDLDFYGKAYAGQYEMGDGNKFDGLAYTAAVNYGLPMGKRGGVFNLNVNYANQGRTFRQEFDGKLYVNNVRRAAGEASLETFGVMFNAESPLRDDDKLNFYTFGGYNRKGSDAYAYTRNFSARPNRFPTDANGDLIPVEGIIKTTPDGENYFNPRILTTIQDISYAAGLNGTTEGEWKWDLSNTTGYNDFHFFGEGTFNAGLGPRPTSFDDGGFSFLQNTTNLNFSKEYNLLSGFGLAFGGEVRAENYQLYAGQRGSYANFNPDKASGAQGFPGYQPSDEVDASRSCVGAYVDAELDVTARWLVGGAVRLENYSDFGATLNSKFATRYKLLDNLNLRGSFSTGFRAPSLQQINFSSTFTTVQGGNIAEVKIAPNYSRITQAAGIEALKQEESTNASIGFSWKPARELTVTLDAYQVQVKDRVVLSGQFSADDATLDPILTSTLRGLNVSLAQFFANAVNTTNRGVDLVLDYNKKMGDNSFRALLAANLQDMTIDKVNVPTKLNDTEGHRSTFLSDRERAFILASAPPVKASLNLEYGMGKLSIGARANFFGEIKLFGYGEDGSGIAPTVPKDDGSGSVPDQYVYGARLVPDLYLGWKICKAASLHIGADNFLNVHPNLGYVPGAEGWAFNNETGGPWDAVQMGGNGMRLFTRVSMSF
jgi:iron complex outermembrane receptor protein